MMGGIDLGPISPERGRRMLKALDEMVARAEPFDGQKFVRDLAEAQAAWERGERGYGIAARIREMEEEDARTTGIGGGNAGGGVYRGERGDHLPGE